MTVGVVLSAPASAQDVQKGMGRNMPAFADFDLNSDGKITEEEFTKARSERIAKRAQEGRQMKNLANAPSFDDIDVDDNGGIDAAEFAAHQAERKAKKSRH
jgi:Ca2+-binding EF-hand superfamily protein